MKLYVKSFIFVREKKNKNYYEVLNFYVLLVYKILKVWILYCDIYVWVEIVYGVNYVF